MKNNALINHYKRLEKQIANITPQVYAGIALALSRKYGWEYEQINEIFAGSQAIWNECVDSGVDMIAMCAEETGIECTSSVNSVIGEEDSV